MTKSLPTPARQGMKDQGLHGMRQALHGAQVADIGRAGTLLAPARAFGSGKQIINETGH